MPSNANRIKKEEVLFSKFPLVSVVIPTFNRAELIKETVESIFSQTWRPIELIVIDDGSTDDTANECKRLAKSAREHNIDFVYRQQQNAGVSVARNTGTKLATGEFIQYLDSDDLLHPHKLEIQANFLLSHPKCGLCLSYCTVVDNPLNHKWENVLSEPIESPYLNYMIFDNIPTSLALYRSNLLTTLPEWEVGHSIREDSIFLMRAMIASEYIGIGKSILSLVRNHDGARLSRNITQERFIDNLYTSRLFLDIVDSTPEDYMRSLTPSLLPHLLSCAKTCIARKWKDLAKEYLHEACRLPLSHEQETSVKRVKRTLRIPNILARILFRLNYG